MPGEALEGTQMAGRLEIETTLASATEVRVAQAYIPEWRLTVDGSGDPVTLRSDPETGLILAELPAGSHHFALFIPETAAEWWGKLASLAGLILMVSAAALFREKPVMAADAARSGL